MARFTQIMVSYLFTGSPMSFVTTRDGASLSSTAA